MAVYIYLLGRSGLLHMSSVMLSHWTITICCIYCLTLLLWGAAVNGTLSNERAFRAEGELYAMGRCACGTLSKRQEPIWCPVTIKSASFQVSVCSQFVFWALFRLRRQVGLSNPMARYGRDCQTTYAVRLLILGVLLSQLFIIRQRKGRPWTTCQHFPRVSYYRQALMFSSSYRLT